MTDIRESPSGVKISTGGGNVDSVFGRSGTVTAQSGDYDASQVDNDSAVTGANVADALNTLAGSIGGVASVYGRTGVVVAQSGDTKASFVTNDSSVAGADVATALDNLDSASTEALNAVTTGILTGGEITVNGGDPAKYDVAAGVCVVEDFTTPLSPNPVRVSFGPFIGEDPLNIATETATYNSINAAGALVKSNTIPDGVDRRNTCRLQTVIHLDGATVTDIDTAQQPAQNLGQALLDYVIANGPVNSGNEYSANAGLTAAKSAGTTSLPFINYTIDNDRPNDHVNVAQDPVSIIQSYQDGVGGFSSSAPTTAWDVGFWDDGSGTLAAVSPAGRYTIKRIYFFGAVDITVVTYGQALYATLEDARAAILTENPNVDPDLANACFCAALIVAGDTVDLTVAADAEIVPINTQNAGGVVVGAGDVVGPASATDNSFARYSGATGKLIQNGLVGADDLGNVTGAESLDIDHTSLADDDFALRVHVDAAGFADVKAVDIAYATGAIVPGEDDEAVLVSIDESTSTGGHVVGLEVLATDVGSADVYAVETGATVNPILQESGTFTDADSLLVLAVDELAALSSGGAGGVSIFVGDNDTMTIGGTVQFSELEFILATFASGNGVAPTFEHSTGVGTWASFVPADGTDGMRQNGVIAWEVSGIPSWAPGTGGEYLIRITRTRNSLATTPVADLVQQAVTVEYSWDKDGDVLVRELSCSQVFTATACTSATVAGAGADSFKAELVPVLSGNADVVAAGNLKISATLDSASQLPTGTDTVAVYTVLVTATENGGTPDAYQGTMTVMYDGATGVTVSPLLDLRDFNSPDYEVIGTCPAAAANLLTFQFNNNSVNKVGVVLSIISYEYKFVEAAP
jgi:hypothetical protein